MTMLSAGMPMMLMGDEVRRTQRGNNNAYCCVVALFARLSPEA